MQKLRVRREIDWKNFYSYLAGNFRGKTGGGSGRGEERELEKTEMENGSVFGVEENFFAVGVRVPEWFIPLKLMSRKAFDCESGRRHRRRIMRKFYLKIIKYRSFVLERGSERREVQERTSSQHTTQEIQNVRIRIYKTVDIIPNQIKTIKYQVQYWILKNITFIIIYLWYVNI